MLVYLHPKLLNLGKDVRLLALLLLSLELVGVHLIGTERLVYLHLKLLNLGKDVRLLALLLLRLDLVGVHLVCAKILVLYLVGLSGELATSKGSERSPSLPTHSSQ